MQGHPIFSSEWFGCHRERLGHWRHGNERQILAELAELQAEVEELLHLQLAKPATVTVTSSNQGEPMSSFAPGQTITFTAVAQNAEQQDVPDTYTWTTTAGTIVPGPDSTTITISDAPLGDVTATATDPNGIAGSTTATVADQTPVSVTVTAS